MLCLYRGKYPGYITSMTLLNKTFLAVNNLNRTIHIFDISNNNNNFNIGIVLFLLAYPYILNKNIK